jgi:hypothetical protein
MFPMINGEFFPLFLRSRDIDKEEKFNKLVIPVLDFVS